MVPLMLSFVFPGGIDAPGLLSKCHRQDVGNVGSIPASCALFPRDI